jgi:phosphopantetheinyl transferase
MPLLKELNLNNAKIALWHIAEDHSFFINALQPTITESILGNISNSKKQLEFLASRYLIKHLAGNEYLANLNKTDNGKPFFYNFPEAISISHSASHAAIIFSNTCSCGIDIETITPRVHKIASRFLSEEELISLDERYLTEAITLLWSAKETIYKWYGKGEISFSKQINLQQPFKFEEKGTLSFNFKIEGLIHSVEVNYEVLGNQILTYTL